MAPVIDIGGQCFIRFHSGLSAGSWDGSTDISNNNIQVIPDVGQTHHYAIVYDGVDTIDYYLDGAPIFQSGNGSPQGITTLISWGNIRHPSVDGGRQLRGEYDAVAFSTFTGSFDPETDFILPGGLGSLPFAMAMAPKNGSMIGATQTTLEWRAGEFAVSHDVYLGEGYDEVDQATPDSVVFQGSQTATTFSVTNLTPGQTYYWRIDEINDAEPNSPWKGEVWSFWVQPNVAWDPSPADGVQYVLLDQDLTWQAGMGALFHTVYLGETFDQVNDATTGGFMIVDAVYDPGLREVEKTYYWRVDEFAPMGTNKGEVWSFTTLPDIAVADESLLAWWTLDEGMATNVVDWSGHGHHGTLTGDTQWQGGYAGGALYFDGRGDYVNLGTPEDLYLTQNYTYTAWFQVGQNIHGNSGAQYLLCIGSRSDLVFGVEDNVGVDGDLMLHYYDTEGGFHAVGIGQTVWSADEWHMVAGTRDENGHNVYLDGELRNSDTNTNEDNFATDRIISLGARAWTGHQYYNGLIDDVRIYNRALTETEIQQVMRGNPLLA